MKRTFTIIFIISLLPILSLAQGFKVVGSDLHDANGNNFIMKGMNVPLAWFVNDVNSNIANIKANTNANALRIVVGNCYTPLDGTGSDWCTRDQDWQRAVELCIANDIVPVIEVHNVLGSNDPRDIVAVGEWWASKADYLTQPHIARYVLINIANEWGDWMMSSPNHSPSQTVWRDAYIQAVKTIRDAGIKTTLIVDAPGYGQDNRGSTLINHALSVLEADMEKNLQFSVHMYCEWSVGGNSNVSTHLPAIKNAGIAINIGEFGPDHPEGNGRICDIDEELIMSTCEANGIGWLAWSWKGNSAELNSLDMSEDWAGTELTTWGNTIVNSTFGTKTAQTASVFLTEDPNEPPLVAITAPTDEAVLIAGSDITFVASASDTDGSIANVRFLNGPTLLGVVTDAPFTFTWQNVPVGTYTITARATDDMGAVTTSDHITLVVKACPETDLGLPQVLCPGSVLYLSSGISNTVGVSFSWMRNGEPIDGVGGSIQVNEAGAYGVRAELEGCPASTDEVVISSGILTVDGNLLCGPGEATLAVSGGTSPYNWYLQASGGEAVATGATFSPSVTETIRYYVADAGAGIQTIEARLGKSAREDASEFWGLSGDDLDGDKNVAITVARTLTIHAVHVYSANAGNQVNIRILRGNTVVGQAKATVGAGMQRVPVNITLEPGSYTMDAVGTTGTLQYQSGGADLPYSIADVISFTGVQSWVINEGRYGLFYDWELSFEVNTACPRTSVVVAVLESDCRPYIAELSSNVSVFEGRSFTLSVDALGIGTLRYQWYRNGEAILGATGTEYTVDIAYEDDEGTYYVIVSDENGETRSEDITVELDRTTNSVSRSRSISLKVYPNPAQGHIIVEYKKPGEHEVTIFNSLSVKVKEEKYHGDLHYMNVHDLPAGLYHLKIRSGNAVEQVSFLVK